MVESAQDGNDAPVTGVAIIGMVGRFPGAANLDALWRNVRDGVESITFFTDEQLLAAGVDPAMVKNPAYVKARGVIEGVDQFDAGFFSYSHRDALLMDPQQRLFLEGAWEALETAGYDPKTYRGLIGVYGGATASSYHALLFSNYAALGGDGLAMAIGNELPFLTTRVSYKLDLKGPSCPVQTACSTSLVAVHLACQGLLSGECDMALAGGVSLRLPQEAGYLFQDEGILSPDGHCRSFDANASGTIFSNGLGIVVLKRLEDAIADGDTVYAVVRGSAINNDGARRASFTAPGVGGQSQVIADALASAEVDPESISYVEAHGTATALGDSIEVQALTKAYGTSERNYCALGSVKANIGHLDAAAGVAGLIKTVLSLQHGQLPPTAHFQKPNPDIQFDATPFYVNHTLREWPRNGLPRRAGVSSFGFGGTNAHVILEEAPALPSSDAARPMQLLVVSADTPAALEQASTNLASYLATHPVDLADAAYTLQVGRRAFRHRRAIVCRSRDEAVRVLETRDAKAVATGSADGAERRVTFLFPGQGAQYVGMARELYEHEETFREIVDRCAAVLAPHLGFDLRTVVFPADGSTPETAERLTRTNVAQPALFVIEYAIARLLMSWGIEPAACLGHSVGELVAACLAGVFAEEDALRLVALRGRLMAEMPPGVMVAVPLPEARVRRLVAEPLCIAAINHTALTVVSGPADAVDAFEMRLREEGVESQRLHTSHAFHSSMMDAAVEPFVRAVAAVARHAPRIPFISNVTGTWITDAQATDAAYWGRQIREAVRFADGVAELLNDDRRVFVEAGPGNTLGTLVRRQSAGKVAQFVISTLRHAREEGSDVASVLGAFGRLWVNGIAIDTQAFFAGEQRRRVALPTYPFERQRYWVDAAAAPASSAAPHRDRVEGRQPDITNWFYAPTWKRLPLPLSANGTSIATPGPWLVVLDDHGLGERLIARLRRAGQEVVTVSAAARFMRIDADRFAVNPASKQDYQLLLRELTAANRAPSVILYLRGAAPGDDRDKPDYEGGASTEFGTLLAFAQALGDAELMSPVRLAIVTSDAFEVTGHELVAPDKAVAIGLARVIPQEYPNVSCRCLDVSWSGAASAFTEQALDRLLQDAAGDHADPVVAYRGGHRWIQAFSELPLKAGAGAPAILRPRGVYLITGGLGDMGLQMARYLARTVQARLILTGRTRLPEPAEWQAYLERSSPHDPVRQRIVRVKELIAAGGDVLVVKADAANRQEMRAAVDAGERAFGPINGVFHAAGLIGGDDFRPIADTDVAAYTRQFQPKITGACVIDELVDGRPIDFCVLVSSLSAILGGLRYSAYASANAFLDAFAYRRNRTSAALWVAINWDNWMRTDDEARLAAGTTPSGFVMTPTEGVEAYARLLSTDCGPQVVVSTGDLHGRLEQWVRVGALQAVDEPASPALRHARPNLQTEYVAPGTDLERAIASIWEELLCVDRVGVNDNFFELGGDSFLGIQVISRLKKQLGAKVSAVTLYEGPRVALLAKIIGADANDAPVFDRSRNRGERRRERKMAIESQPLGT